MNHEIFFEYGDSLIGQESLKQVIIQLEPEIQRIHQAITHQNNSPYSFLQLPFDETLRKKVIQLVEQKKALQPTALFIIGIGGSNLGTKAIHEALAGIFYNEINGTLRCYYVDTIEDQYTNQLLTILEKLLQRGDNALLVVVSKSGTTTETLANAALFIDLLAHYRPQTFSEYLVAITDEESPLWKSAQESNVSVLSIPRSVGGRFSVLSAVGLFPLSFLSFNSAALQAGARRVLENFPHNKYAKMAAEMAALIFLHYQAGRNILDTFIFGPSLGSLGAWYRQLVGESLGKDNKGMTPTVSIGSTDLHSVTQLYLGGPADKFTIFITGSYKESLEIPLTLFSKNLGQLPLARLQQAILQGVQQAYKKREHPFVAFDLGMLTEETLGTFLSMRMLEIVYVGFLLKVNPFDQPEVELYKEQTRKVLAS
ncbi:MAG: hypothetical protein WA432_01700 [Candidatus Babeliaceae bacterium]